MGRPAKGWVRWNVTDQVWTVRVTVGKGDRSKPIKMTGLPPCAVSPARPSQGCACGPCVFAQEAGQRTAKEYRESGAVPNETSLTVNEWFGKYYAEAARGAVGRKNRGRPQASVDDRKARFAKWIGPLLGTKPMACATAADLRRVVQTLDEQVLVRVRFYAEREDDDEPFAGRKPGISPKTAANIWGEVTNGFKEAMNSKLDALRVLDVNPALGVLPPTTGEDREQAALYPSEVIDLLAASMVARSRRRLYWAAIYTGMRRSELARVEAIDVDLDHGVMRVRGRKTNAAKRQIPIEPALRPLLAALVKARPTGPLFDVPRADGKGGTSDLVKRDLVRAKITRADLTRDDADHMPFTFHGLRHTAITHWAVAGREARWLLLVSGHTDQEMTMRYLDQAAVVRGQFGTPHPALPSAVIADLLADLEGTEVPSEAVEGVLHRSATEVPSPNSKTGNPEGLPVVLTSHLRPQRESNGDESSPESTAFDARGHENEASSAIEVAAESPPIVQPDDPDTELADLVATLIKRGDRARALRLMAAYQDAAPLEATAGKVVPLADVRARLARK